MIRAELTTEPAGAVEIAPLPDHLLRIHTGPPSHGACRVRKYHMTSGDIHVMPAGTSGFWVGRAPATLLLIHLSPALLRRAAEQMGLDPARAGVEARHQFRDPRIEYVAWALEAESRAGSPNGTLYADCLGMALSFHMLGQYAARAPRPAQALSPAQLRQVVDYIDAHLDRDLSLFRLAEVVGISASHLKRLFKRSMGLPIHEYVMRRRVERAKVLLSAGKLPPIQVALEAGFAHQSHMARWVRRVLGVAPHALRLRGAGVRT